MTIALNLKVEIKKGRTSVFKKSTVLKYDTSRLENTTNFEKEIQNAYSNMANAKNKVPSLNSLLEYLPILKKLLNNFINDIEKLTENRPINDGEYLYFTLDTDNTYSKRSVDESKESIIESAEDIFKDKLSDYLPQIRDYLIANNFNFSDDDKHTNSPLKNVW